MRTCNLVSTYLILMESRLSVMDIIPLLQLVMMVGAEYTEILLPKR